MNTLMNHLCFKPAYKVLHDLSPEALFSLITRKSIIHFFVPWINLWFRPLGFKSLFPLPQTPSFHLISGKILVTFQDSNAVVTLFCLLRLSFAQTYWPLKLRVSLHPCNLQISPELLYGYIDSYLCMYVSIYLSIPDMSILCCPICWPGTGPIPLYDPKLWKMPAA